MVATPAGKILRTGQHSCYDGNGVQIDCRGSGQDGEYRKGVPWPQPRFRPAGEVVEDRLTGLCWTTDANPAEYPLAWQECYDFIREMNGNSAFGYADWRLPDRNELRSLISYQAKRPALPKDHPFVNVFPGWYWSSTTAAINPAYAWYVHMDGARMFYGHKEQYSMLWPVRGASAILPPTGEIEGPDDIGSTADCLSAGPVRERPGQRFIPGENTVLDLDTGLRWLRRADLSGKQVSWSEALQLVARMNDDVGGKGNGWRLPNVNELESLVDCSRHTPALGMNHPFEEVRDVYWSSTTSFFEPDWAWALYLDKGALGVGFKKKQEFYVWPVRDG